MILPTAEEDTAYEAYRDKVAMLPQIKDADTSRAFHAMEQNLPEREELHAACMEYSDRMPNGQTFPAWSKFARGTITLAELYVELLFIGAEL